MELLKVSQLRHPKLYVRSNDITIKDLLDIAKFNKNDKKQLVWPFPAIDVVKDGSNFEILDGNRRTRVAKALKIEAIPATIKTIKSPVDRFLFQIQSNLHGLMLDKDQRDSSIRLLNTKFKLSLENLAKTFKLTKASISRILSKKQRKEGPRKTTKQESKSNSQSFNPANFLREVVVLAFEYAKNRIKLSEFLEHTQDLDKAKAVEFLTNINSLVVLLETSLIEKESK